MTKQEYIDELYQIRATVDDLITKVKSEDIKDLRGGGKTIVGMTTEKDGENTDEL